MDEPIILMSQEEFKQRQINSVVSQFQDAEASFDIAKANVRKLVAKYGRKGLCKDVLCHLNK